MATYVKITVKSLNGTPIEDATVNMAKTDKGVYTESLDKGVHSFHVEAPNYKGQDFYIEITDEDAISKDVILLSMNTNSDMQKAKQDITRAVEPVAMEVIKSFIFNQPKDFNDAKAQYKNLEANIKAQKDSIEKAIKSASMDIFQAQATNLIYTAKSQLQPAMDYYVNERKKYNPLKSWADFRKWSECTSMIAGIYLLRQNLVKYTNALLEKIQDKF